MKREGAPEPNALQDRGRFSVLGRQISHYRVTGKLGLGGMGVVYEAEDTRLARLVALKFLPEELADDADAVRRLKREAQIIALLQHPHICTVYDIGSEDGRTFIAMERADGVNLRTWMARAGRIETADIVRIATAVAQALGAAHGKGIVHRDIKPGNIVVGEAGSVKVLDFGLARSFLPVEAGGAPIEGSTLPDVRWARSTTWRRSGSSRCRSIPGATCSRSAC